MNQIVGANHEFHDATFAKGWADRFVPTTDRLKLFDTILSQLRIQIPADGCLVELGIGPGYLADYLLQALPEVQYCGVDFSKPMLEIARQRLQAHSNRVQYIQADLLKDSWWNNLPTPTDAIVSTWALHDLGSQTNIELVYRSCAETLHKDGLLLNGDFIKPDKAKHQYEPGRFEIAKHLAMLNRVGFQTAECLIILEAEIEAPTSAHNYACLKAIK